jgi:hypothetical protein
MKLDFQQVDWMLALVGNPGGRCFRKLVNAWRRLQSWSPRFVIVGLGLAACWLIALQPAGECAGQSLRETDPESIDFNRDIRPILSENCFFCHGQDPHARAAGLRLDDRQELLDAGVIDQQALEASLLLERIFSDDMGSVMPPPTSQRKLSGREKELLRRWVSKGAEYQQHWAFVAPRLPVLPDNQDPGWVRNPIDQFVLAKMQSAGLTPSPEAPRHVLIKRLYADLIGLPPNPAEVREFLLDQRPDAYEQLVDRLLANPHYGERMALPWLDAARYADSNGFQQDGDHWQWIWRDWVVQALNRDLPFDQFSIWQLAGDLLVDPTEEQKIATAFNRNHLLNGEGGAIAEEQRFVVLFDRVDTTATNWLGLTMACAQCHDHKYDPISQREYYQFLDLFNRLPENGVPTHFSSRIRLDQPLLELPTEENQRQIERLEEEIAAAAEDQRAPLQGQLEGYRKDQIPRLMIMDDRQPRTTRILQRGEYLMPGEPVAFDTPGFLPALPAELPRNRLGFAQWLFLPEHPLTARVQVNRIWQHFFGRGLVATSEDFGVQSDYPVQLELLDWLAIEFQRVGWSLKSLQRLILTSATYRQSSRLDPLRLELDPENVYFSRASRFRMPAMILRDWALAASGLLNERIGGPPVYPYQPDRVWESLAITKERDFSYPLSRGEDLYRRSLYTFWRRTVGPANMFDASNRQACRVRGSVTSTPLHALVTLNDPTWVEAARVLAVEVLQQHAELTEQLGEVFFRVVCRPPDPRELELLQTSYLKQLEIYRQNPELARQLISIGEAVLPGDFPETEGVSLAALTNVCLLIFNLDEALTRE